MDKIRTSVTLLPATLEWISGKVQRCTFSSTSHAIDYLVAEAKRKEDLNGEENP
jgi:Arc/MetJ-type ribon-helix-helix transcriptional regulator